MKPLNTIGRRFADALAVAVAQNDQASAVQGAAKKIHVTGAGRTLTFAYEQLRNAAEYTEEHLLLQRAIQRFYKRYFLANSERGANATGEELIIELTLAGYLQNDSISEGVINGINLLADQYLRAQAKQNNESWTFSVLAVEIERLLNGDLKRDVFVQFAYDHFLATIDKEKLFASISKGDYEVGLFVAVHQALLKSDPAIIRTALLRRYRQNPATGAFVQTNEMIDKVLDSTATDKLYHVVSRRGAPLRVLWRLVDEHENTIQLLNSREQFLSAYDAQITHEYSRINSRINRGIVRSVIFLIITKFLIGISIEVPYDYAVHGGVVWLPLAINLLFPPVYMILLRFTLRLPGHANSMALADSVDELLYRNDDLRSIGSSRQKRAGFGAAFNVAYALIFIVVFGGVAWWLLSFGFSLLHLFIFFAFLSTASFLGFRLSRQIRELEVINGQQSGVTMVRDFLYIPFVVVGRWMSEKYARVNVVAMILDMAIELPLKTILHLVRQWGSFITNKKDEL